VPSSAVLGGANDVDLAVSSLQIDTREHLGQDLWGKGFPDNNKLPFALQDSLQIVRLGELLSANHQ
jgi:hypothetical protein